MLNGLIDLHVHTAPDVRPRRLDDVAQARLARSVGATGLLLKSHVVPTMDRARLTEQLVPGIRVFGALVLNETVGGLNPAAVQAAAALGARVIWLPTLDAANHRRRSGKAGGIAMLRDGRLDPALNEILTLVARHDLALATGHISPDEIHALVPAAFDAGVRRVVVTHPEHAIVSLSLKDQVRLAARHPVIFERCYAHPGPDGHYLENAAANLAAVRELGPDSTYLSTDCGQLENTSWDEAWLRTCRDFLAAGISPEAYRHMTQDIPAFVVGITDARPATFTAAANLRAAASTLHP